METTEITDIVTTAVSDDLPALTDVTNGIQIFFYDVSQYNGNSARWWDSVSRYCNNVINSIKSCEKYFSWIHDVADNLYNSETFPVIFGSMISIALFFLLIDFIRNR